MSNSNGVIRIGRKGRKKFAFGEEGKPFEVDVVEAWQQWVIIDDNFRPPEANEDGARPIPTAEWPAYHQAAVAFVTELSGTTSEITIAEALDFIARLREEYEDLAVFFHPKSRQERASPDTSEVELRFSTEPQMGD